MPRTKPLKFFVSEKDKAFVYNTLKNFSSAINFEPETGPRHLEAKTRFNRRKDIIKLALKFPPGTTPVYLQVWERQVIVRWLMKLHNIAEVRQQEILKERFKALIEIFK